MRRNYLITLLAAVALSTMPIGGQARGPQDGERDKPKAAPVDQDKVSLWMKEKLDYSQKVLEGLTQGDYEKILQHARAMNVLGYLESWSRADIPGYREQARMFTYADRALIRAAQEKNLDGATLAYNQLTVSCVQCHKLVRDAKVSR